MGLKFTVAESELFRRCILRANRLAKPAVGPPFRWQVGSAERAIGACTSNRHVPPAVNVNSLAGDIGRFRQQEMHGARDVLRRAIAPQRRMRNDPLLRQLVEPPEPLRRGGGIGTVGACAAGGRGGVRVIN